MKCDWGELPAKKKIKPIDGTKFSKLPKPKMIKVPHFIDFGAESYDEALEKANYWLMSQYRKSYHSVITSLATYDVDNKTWIITILYIGLFSTSAIKKKQVAK